MGVRGAAPRGGRGPVPVRWAAWRPPVAAARPQRQRRARRFKGPSHRITRPLSDHASVKGHPVHVTGCWRIMRPHGGLRRCSALLPCGRLRIMSPAGRVSRCGAKIVAWRLDNRASSSAAADHASARWRSLGRAAVRPAADQESGWSCPPQGHEDVCLPRRARGALSSDAVGTPWAAQGSDWRGRASLPQDSARPAPFGRRGGHADQLRGAHGWSHLAAGFDTEHGACASCEARGCSHARPAAGSKFSGGTSSPLQIPCAKTGGCCRGCGAGGAGRSRCAAVGPGAARGPCAPGPCGAASA